MKKLVLALALTAVILPVGGVAATASGGMCQVWSGGGWLGAPCPSTAPTAPTTTAPPTTAPQVSIPTERISGASRYDTAAAVSASHFAPGVKAVYIANGNGIDAVVAGAAVDGPILTVPATGTLPASTSAELARLDPEKVVVIGGKSSVSDNMVAQAVTAAAK